MTPKKDPATESFSIVEQLKTNPCIPNLNLSKLSILLSLPKKILLEIARYTQRNPIIPISCSLKTKKENFCTCPSCLNAHIQKKFKNSKLLELIEDPIGHEGYYLDKSRLSKI